MYWQIFSSIDMHKASYHIAFLCTDCYTTVVTTFKKLFIGRRTHEEGYKFVDLSENNAVL